jgi:predicted Fe-S protein YdhL (DUF1289 family)
MHRHCSQTCSNSRHTAFNTQIDPMSHHTYAEQTLAAGFGPRIRVESDDWSGKSAEERRRIQNRLNQRAHRQRQRQTQTPERGDSSDPQDGRAGKASTTSSPGDSRSTPSPTERSSRTSGGAAADELAKTINLNVVQAVFANLRVLGIDPTALRPGNNITTPRPTTTQQTDVSLNLAPIKLQYQVPHDPIIDAIPHARFRFNVLRAVATGQLDPSSLSAGLRRSGAVASVAGRPMRMGVIVWGSPDDFRNWELSEGFVITWGALLEGCEDWIEATNARRRQREDEPLQRWQAS